MKTGIVTQPLIDNYGGILQNFALQQVLIKMGHSPITLDYLPSLSLGKYILYAGKGVLCAPFPSKRHSIKPYKHFLERPQPIDRFVRNNMSITRTIPDYSNHLLKKNGIEALIVGSDQVWRYSYNSHYLEDMFLDFAKDYPCRKVVYGASFGVETWDYPEKRAIRVRELIKQFDAVSVRENSGGALCREELGIEAVTVLDPTLLLCSSDYEKFCAPARSGEEPYLAAYVLDMTPEKSAYIKSVAKSKGLKIKEITVPSIEVSIEGWLTAIKNADFVITDSYHGSLFSILFERQFQTILNPKRGTDRFLTLFEKLHLPALLTDSPGVFSTHFEQIDYPSVSVSLSTLRKNSLSFLASSLS